MDERELRAAVLGIITYAYIAETGKAPEFDENGVLEAFAYLDDEILEMALEVCSQADLDMLELWEEEDDEDDDA